MDSVPMLTVLVPSSQLLGDRRWIAEMRPPMHAKFFPSRTENSPFSQETQWLESKGVSSAKPLTGSEETLNAGTPAMPQDPVQWSGNQCNQCLELNDTGSVSRNCGLNPQDYQVCCNHHMMFLLCMWYCWWWVGIGKAVVGRINPIWHHLSLSARCGLKAVRELQQWSQILKVYPIVQSIILRIILINPIRINQWFVQ